MKTDIAQLETFDYFKTKHFETFTLCCYKQQFTKYIIIAQCKYKYRLLSILRITVGREINF